ncbi:carbohydrate ABC transporter membrane protein 2, CUT1 family [Kytococcus aerolatus]|uniref:Carbohydrate ABC transporter membrane protein 2, CUT1 family n=1 Tax=Kytococcus aerolatus TaxID=592308 RepID=A0A212U5R1_9MICO|nr:sugar ABC transporter permease [Kytococcus aerolatus]SNC73602.1 carbohydrate ABC transporter membrane protein 2, CUT1 family [Kytococcus aerolatus]
MATRLPEDTVRPAAAVDPEVPTTRVVGRRRSTGTWWRHLLVWLAIAWALFPILFILSAALNPAGTLSTSGLLPRAFSTSNWSELFASRPYWTWYRNALVISLVATAGAVFIGACAAYAFSRLRFAGRRPGLMALLLVQMFPALLTFVALYFTMVEVGEVLPEVGLNTTTGLILVYLGGAMGANIWLLKGYFDTVPRELDEAARIDGASHVRIFFTMTLRLVAPILVTVAMLAFVQFWGEFMLASIFLKDVDSQTLGVGLWQMQQGNEKNANFGEFAAGALLASLPVVVLYLTFQRQLVSGLTSGSVK